MKNSYRVNGFMKRRGLGGYTLSIKGIKDKESIDLHPTFALFEKIMSMLSSAYKSKEGYAFQLIFAPLSNSPKYQGRPKGVIPRKYRTKNNMTSNGEIGGSDTDTAQNTEKVGKRAKSSGKTAFPEVVTAATPALSFKDIENKSVNDLTEDEIKVFEDEIMSIATSNLGEA